MAEPTAVDDLLVRIHASPEAIDAVAWDRLLDAQPAPTPFSCATPTCIALHASASAVPATGWTPQILTVERDGALLAGAALYLKAHSYGEYVFDWAWADAYRRHGLRYYPKLLGAVPFTPVPGTRLLARDDALRSLLVQAIHWLARDTKLSSAHVLFVDDADRAAFERAGWMIREGVQFHWTRDAADPAPDFAAFLARLQRDKRKKIRQERRAASPMPASR